MDFLLHAPEAAESAQWRNVSVSQDPAYVCAGGPKYKLKPPVT